MKLPRRCNEVRSLSDIRYKESSVSITSIHCRSHCKSSSTDVHCKSDHRQTGEWNEDNFPLFHCPPVLSTPLKFFVAELTSLSASRPTGGRRRKLFCPLLPNGNRRISGNRLFMSVAFIHTIWR